MLLAALALPARAAPGDSLCVLAQEPAQVVSACTEVIGEKVLRASVRAQAHALRGWARARSNDSGGARADFDAALELDADSVSALLGRGTSEGNNGQAEAALADFARVEKLEPGNTALHVDRAQFFIAQHRYGEAVADAEFQRYGTGAGNTFLNLRCRARAYGGIDLDKARLACDQALWLQPDAPALLEARGIAALKQKRYDAALADFTHLGIAAPRAARAWYGKGLVEGALGRDTDARADIARAKSLNSDIAALYAGYGLTPN
jgi:tetratricopeptide (TPR) repeat protein